MTKAPKEIWAWVDALAGVVGQTEEPETPQNIWPGPNATTYWAHYVRADLMGWQPIETAPKDGSYIIACSWQQGRTVAVPTIIIFDDVLGWSGRTARDELLLVRIPPTHWMPLPEPPDA